MSNFSQTLLESKGTADKYVKAQEKMTGIAAKNQRDWDVRKKTKVLHVEVVVLSLQNQAYA